MTAPTASPIRVLTVDDEPLARERVSTLVRGTDGLELVGEGNNGLDALDLITRLEPDLVFIDVEMPELSGFGVIAALGGARVPAVVFITAFDQFAVAAFDVAAIDYLMKPVDAGRLSRSIDRARAYLQSKAEQVHEEAPAAASPWLEEFWASDLSGLVRIASRDIDRVTAERDYMRLHVAKRSWLIHHSMSALEEGLNPDLFVRLHRSAIVRRDFIAGFTRNASGRWIARLGDGNEQPVGRLYAAQVRAIAGR